MLQRTMVVVEGVSRSLDPHMNIWNVAQPIVESYIKESIGPRAAAGDLWKTVKVLARFGPRLPDLVEAALIHQSQIESDKPRRLTSRSVFWLGLGTACGIFVATMWQAVF